MLDSPQSLPLATLFLHVWLPKPVLERIKGEYSLGYVKQRDIGVRDKSKNVLYGTFKINYFMIALHSIYYSTSS